MALKSDTPPAEYSTRLSATAPWMDERTMGDFQGTGAQCAGDATEQVGQPGPASPYPPGEGAKPPSDVCPKGKTSGTVNGVFVCVQPGITKTNGVEKVTAPTTDGIKESEVSKNTVCTGDKCVTTTTTTDTVTSTTGTKTTTTGTTTKETGKTGFCVENPKDAQCGGASSFGGDCGKVPACTGDAVECAIAAQTFKTACALDPPAGAESAAYDAAKVLTGNRTGALPGNRDVVLSPALFSSENILGASAGMTDLTITVVGRTVTLPFSSVNVWLERLGMILQAVAFLVSIKIVTRE